MSNMPNYAQLLCDNLKKQRAFCDKDHEDENCRKTLDMQLCRNGCGNCEGVEEMSNVKEECIRCKEHKKHKRHTKIYLLIVLLLVILVLLHLNHESIMTVVRKV